MIRSGGGAMTYVNIGGRLDKTRLALAVHRIPDRAP